MQAVKVTISYHHSSTCTGETLVGLKTAPVKEPLTDSQLCVHGQGGGCMTSLHQKTTTHTLHHRTRASLGVTVLLLNQGLVEGSRGWDGWCRGVQVLAVLAGAGPGGSHGCS